MSQDLVEVYPVDAPWTNYFKREFLDISVSEAPFSRLVFLSYTDESELRSVVEDGDLVVCSVDFLGRVSLRSLLSLEWLDEVSLNIVYVNSREVLGPPYVRRADVHSYVELFKTLVINTFLVRGRLETLTDESSSASPFSLLSRLSFLTVVELKLGGLSLSSLRKVFRFKLLLRKRFVEEKFADSVCRDCRLLAVNQGVLDYSTELKNVLGEVWGGEFGEYDYVCVVDPLLSNGVPRNSTYVLLFIPLKLRCRIK